MPMVTPVPQASDRAAGEVLLAWRRATTHRFLAVLVLAQTVPVATVLFAPGLPFGRAARVVSLICYALLVLSASARRADHRVRVWLMVAGGYLMAVVDGVAIPQGPFVRTLPVLLAVAVLVLIGEAAARVAAALSAGAIVAVTLLLLAPGPQHALRWPGAGAPGPVPPLGVSYALAQMVSLLAMLGCQMLLLQRFHAAWGRSLEEQQRVTEALADEMRQRARLEQEVLSIGERERQRLSAEIHDGLCQDLTSGLLQAATLQSRLAREEAPEAELAQSVCAAIGTMMDDAYAIARGLQAPDIAPDGLGEALRRLLGEVEAGGAVRCQLHLMAEPRLASAQACQLYRIAQEAVRNVLKHSGARRLWVSLTADDAAVSLTVCDDGRGLPADSDGGAGTRRHGVPRPLARRHTAPRQPARRRRAGPVPVAHRAPRGGGVRGMTSLAGHGILLVDDHPAVRHGLGLLLSSSGYAIQGEADSLEATLAALEPAPPAVAIVDLSLGEADGLPVIVALVARDVPVLVYSMHEDAGRIRQALAAGACGYVTKREAASTLLHAVAQVMLRRRYLSERAASAMADWPAANGEPESAQLSRREEQVFLLLGQGHGPEAIARALQISDRTVEGYAQRIMTKLGVANMRELRQRAIRAGHPPAS